MENKTNGVEVLGTGNAVENDYSEKYFEDSVWDEVQAAWCGLMTEYNGSIPFGTTIEITFKNRPYTINMVRNAASAQGFKFLGAETKGNEVVIKLEYNGNK